MAKTPASIPFRDSDEKVGVVQRQVRRAVTDVSSTPIVQGVTVSAKLDSTKTVLVSHRLGRKYVGWHVVDIDSHATVIRDTTSSADPGLYVPLKASAGTPNVKIWVF